MKSTRNSVPPSGASGISTAMLAESARKPLKIDQSITGVFPVAISTIMVSPTARPKPIMIAEKIPGLAVGNTTRSAVCQRVAPSASEPARRCWGTLASESSAMVKMMGMTANPMATPDDQRVALVVGEPEDATAASRGSRRPAASVST